MSAFFLLMTLFGAPLRAQSTEDVVPDLEKAVNKLRTLYQDMYPRFRDIQMYRDGNQAEQAQDVVSDVKEEINSRLNTVRQHLDSVNSNRPAVKKRVQNVRSIADYFHRYQKKVLSNWKPENPQLLNAFNDRELMQRGMASPEILRKAFLKNLMGAMLTEGYVGENVPAKNLNSYAEKVQSTYRDVLNTLLGLLNRIDRARTDNAEKEVKEVIENANREWASFWKSFQEEREALREKINRTLNLYRNRDHLTSYQKLRYDKGVRIKRQFNEIMEFKKSVSADNLFANQKAIYKLLVLMGKRYGKRLVDLLNENTASHIAMVQKFMQNSERLKNVTSESEHKNLRSRTDEWLDAVFGEFNLESAVTRIRKVPVKQLSSLVRRLKENYGRKEKRLATTIDNLRAYAIDFFNFSEKARRFPEQFVERFKQVSFESEKQFRKAFPGPLTEDINALNQKQNQLTTRLDKLEKQLKTVIEKHFSSDKTKNSAAKQ